jgi:hypothetical protein
MRVSSDTTIHFSDGSIGYAHSLDGNKKSFRRVVFQKKESPPIDAECLHNRMLSRTLNTHLFILAGNLGVKLESLHVLKTAWDERSQAYAFPMRDGNGKIVGVRLRNFAGKKWAVTGSKSGIFMPYMNPAETVYITEGPTDTAAAHTMGLYAIGRPSCSGGANEIKQVVQQRGIKRMVVIADNDGPGLLGAETLVKLIPIRACLMTLPCKDIREFVNLGGTASVLKSMEKDMVWHGR